MPSIFAINLGGTGRAPEITVKNTAGNLTTGQTHTFDPTRLGTEKTALFTIENSGEEEMNGLAVSLDGAQADEFEIVQGLASASLAPGSSGTFSVRFRPTVTGTRAAVLHIVSNDADENPFDIVLNGPGSNPEILIESTGGAEIVNGGTFDFGDQQAGQTTERILLVKNTGIGSLFVTSATLDDENNNSFWISASPRNAWIAPGGSRQLHIQFNSNSYGTRQPVKLTISSDEEDEGTYEINLIGTGLLPGIRVKDSAGNVPRSQPYDFGTATLGAAGTTQVFTIENPGNQPLTLSTQVYGTHAADFSVVSPPAATVLPGETTTMTVQFFPKNVSARQASLKIIHNATTSPTGASQEYIHLVGTGQYSLVSFVPNVQRAFHGDSQAVVTLRRTTADEPAVVRWRL